MKANLAPLFVFVLLWSLPTAHAEGVHLDDFRIVTVTDNGQTIIAVSVFNGGETPVRIQLSADATVGWTTSAGGDYGDFPIRPGETRAAEFALSHTPTPFPDTSGFVLVALRVRNLESRDDHRRKFALVLKDGALEVSTEEQYLLAQVTETNEEYATLRFEGYAPPPPRRRTGGRS